MAVALDKSTEQGRRDHALLLFLYNTGARADEAAQATIGDLTLAFWSHLDTTKELEGDPTYEFKRRFIAEHDVAVFRFHDHWHRMKPDGISAGMTRELGWEKNAVSEGSREFVFDVATLGGLVRASPSIRREMRIRGLPLKVIVV